MTPGEIDLANFPFGDAPGMKLRPVVLPAPRHGPTTRASFCRLPTVDFRQAQVSFESLIASANVSRDFWSNAQHARD